MVLGLVLGVVLESTLGTNLLGSFVGGILCGIVHAVYGFDPHRYYLWLGFLPVFTYPYHSSLEALLIAILSYATAIPCAVLVVRFLQPRRNNSS